MMAIGVGGGETSFTYKHIVWALFIISLFPIMLAIVLTPVASDEWQDEYQNIADQYYEYSGSAATAGMELWTLTGIYTPYTSVYYGYTEDGWLYGTSEPSYSPNQLSGAQWSGESYTVAKADNGLWYYTSAPSNNSNIVAATTDEYGHITGTDGATVYSSVMMDNEHKSNVFFTAGDKTVIDGHYYYSYSGWRYAFQPLHSYKSLTDDGDTIDVIGSKSSLSLIWYQYNTLSGIAGQLSINADPSEGVSYIGAQDIIRAYNGVNFSATFDMKFASVPMHIQIRLNPTAIAQGYSIEDCWNGGYWSVMVYGDRTADEYIGGTVFDDDDFSIKQIFDVFIKLFTFRLADEYGIDGWVGIMTSLVFSIAFYSMILAVGVSNPVIWGIIIFAGIFQAIATLGSGWWPF